jgi:hypothetical protein
MGLEEVSGKEWFRLFSARKSSGRWSFQQPQQACPPLTAKRHAPPVRLVGVMTLSIGRIVHTSNIKKQSVNQLLTL